MLSMLGRNWWVFALRGVIAILFGLLALIWPGLTLATLVLFFGAYALVDGIFSAIAGVASIGNNQRWWAMLLVGLAGIIIGLITLFNPAITAVVLITLIAVWAIITGIFEIVAAIQMRRSINNEWMLILGGILSIIFGVLLFMSPAAGALALVTIIGIFAIVFGVTELILAFRVRSAASELSTTQV